MSAEAASERLRRLDSLDPRKRGLLLKMLQEQAARQAGETAIPRRKGVGPAPLSFGQRRLWFISRLAPGSPAYNIPFAVRMRGGLDLPALWRGLCQIVDRHEVLRARFEEDGEGQPVQRVAARAFLPFPLVDLSALPESQGEGVARSLALEEAARPFDLARGPLLRAVLVRLASADHVALFTLHHAVFDGWSTGIFTRELAAFYEAGSTGRAAALAPLSIQYADYAEWQRERLRGEILENDLAYWRERLAGAPPILDLPTDHPRPAMQSFRGAARAWRIPPAAAAGLGRLAGQRGITSFMVLLAVFQVLLGRYTRRFDLLVGAPIANRTRAELEPLIGFFVNTLVLRADLAGSPSFDQLLARTAETVLGAYDHQDLPFEKLLDELAPPRSLSHNPLVQVSFALQNAPAEDARRLPGELSLAPFPTSSRSAQFDLSLALNERGGDLAGEVQWSVALFDATTIERFQGHFIQLLAGVAADRTVNVWEIPLLAEAERHQLVTEWSAGAVVPRADCSLVDRIAEQARLTPDAVAVACEEEVLSYAELARQAGRLARHLRSLGVEPDAPVVLLIERSLEMMVGLLGIVTAGGAYVPLDPDYPAERLATMAEDALEGLFRPVVLTVRSLAGRLESRARLVLLDAGEEWGAIDTGDVALPAVPADSLAYVIYTSGSTGKPKGVMVSHRAIVNRLLWMQEAFGLAQGERVLQKTSFGFDVSVWELFWPLMVGGTVIFARPGGQRDGSYLVDLIAEREISTLHFVPSMLQAFLEQPGLKGGGPLRRVIVSGEALPSALARRFFPLLDAELHNLYGPTEAAVDVSRYTCLPGFPVSPVPIGRPITNLEIHLLDAGLLHVAMGLPAEIYLGGIGLARGYLGRPELTAASFVPHPASETPGARLYRTGDLGRYLPGGEIEYLGRIDDQIKIRGFRVEPGEIEAVLGRHPGVAAATVVVHQDGSLDKQLVAYVVGADGAAPSVESLRRHLGERLPSHMVPTRFVSLESLPLTANGKVDRRRLPAPGGARPDLGQIYVAPSRPLEETLCAIWCAVVKLDQVGIHDNFFALGGDSILSLRVVALAGERGLALSLADLFRHQTVAELATCLAERREVGSEGQSLLACEPFSLVREDDRDRLPQDLEDAYPIAMLQAGMLYHMAMNPDEPLYHNVDSWHVRTRLEPAPLEEAVRRVVARHPILRTSFALTGYGEPLQLVHREAELPVLVEDIRHLVPAEQEARIDRLIAEEKGLPFDLSRPPQLRFHVFLRSAETAQLTVVENHAIFDGWSLHATLAEIFEIYFSLLGGAASVPEPPLPLTYRHYVALERKALQSPVAESFWSSLLADHQFVELPQWPAGPPDPSAPRMQDLGLPVSPSLLAGLTGLARQGAVPLKSVFLAAHLKVLAALSGQSDVTTGIVTNGRLEQPGGDQVRGMFLNTLPFRLDLGESTWLQLVRRVFALEQDLLDHRRYPLAVLQRHRGDQPLFDVAFNFIHFHVVRELLQSDQVEVLGGKGAEGASFKLFAHFIVHPRSGQLELHLEYDSHVLPRAQVQATAGCYGRVLAAMVNEDPARLHTDWSCLSLAETHQAIWEWNDVAGGPGEDACLTALFEAQVARTPEAVALVHEASCLTYRELADRADRLACRLQALGVGPEVVVGLYAERSPDLVAGLLGILKAGGAYLPLDPSYPPQRLIAMLEDAQTRALALSARLLPLAPRSLALVTLEDEPVSGVPRSYHLPGSLAYLIYTSGSTGRPKAVAITHGNAAAFVRWAASMFSARELSGVLASTSLAFDLSVFELFVPLSTGGKVILATNALELPDLVDRAAVRLVNTVPSVLSELLAAGGLPPGVETVTLAGEALSRDLVTRTFASPGVRRVVNLYGPSEDTTYSTLAEQAPDESRQPSIGRPLSGKRLHLLDRRLSPMLPGGNGEIYLGGHGLARGYLGRPDLTAERFVPDPFGAEEGGRLYRTGDLGRRRLDGEIEFLGRIDQQVKLRGFRIEPGEIETVLARHGAVRRSLVVMRQSRPGQGYLVAYVVVEEDGVGKEELRGFLRASLPEHMVPTAWVFLTALPLLPNGKVDRRALPQPELSPQGDFVAPEGEVEEAVAEIWRELLGVESVGRHDNFFDIGGHSLLVVPLRNKLQERFAREISMLAMFRHSTVSAIAAHLLGSEEGSLAAVRKARSGGLEEGRERLQQMLRQRRR